VIGAWLGIRGVFIVMGVLVAAAFIPNRRITDEALSEAERG